MLFVFCVDTQIPPASSELCTNSSMARISDVIWNEDCQRGAALLPKQHIYLCPWISFPPQPNLVPFNISSSNIELNKENLIHILLETELVPQRQQDNNDLMVSKQIFHSFKCIF